jgi:hypothetical protein
MAYRDPDDDRRWHRYNMRRRRAAAAEVTATEWCVLCGHPCKNARGKAVHETQVHESAS